MKSMSNSVKIIMIMISTIIQRPQLQCIAHFKTTFLSLRVQYTALMSFRHIFGQSQASGFSPQPACAPQMLARHETGSDLFSSLSLRKYESFNIRYKNQKHVQRFLIIIYQSSIVYQKNTQHNISYQLTSGFRSVCVQRSQHHTNHVQFSVAQARMFTC